MLLIAGMSTVTVYIEQPVVHHERTKDEEADGFLGGLTRGWDALAEGAGAVLVDFTHPSVVYEHTRAAIAYGVHPVIGTTGLSPEQLADLASFAEKASMGGAVIPNFSVGKIGRAHV